MYSKVYLARGHATMNHTNVHPIKEFTIQKVWRKRAFYQKLFSTPICAPNCEGEKEYSKYKIRDFKHIRIS